MFLDCRKDELRHFVGWTIANDCLDSIVRRSMRHSSAPFPKYDYRPPNQQWSHRPRTQYKSVGRLMSSTFLWRWTFCDRWSFPRTKNPTCPQIIRSINTWIHIATHWLKRKDGKTCWPFILCRASKPWWHHLDRMWSTFAVNHSMWPLEWLLCGPRAFGSCPGYSMPPVPVRLDFVHCSTVHWSTLA